jgi:tRNA(adenine34) deaminase
MNLDGSSEAFMAKTLELAQKALEAGELPIAALVVRGTKILCSARTEDKKQGRRLVHAEFLALQKVDAMALFPANRKELSLFTNLEPCFLCVGAAITMGIGEIHFALESPIDGATHLLPDYERQVRNLPGYNIPQIHHGLLRNESQELFQAFVSKARPGGLKMWTERLLHSLESHTGRKE